MKKLIKQFYVDSKFFLLALIMILLSFKSSIADQFLLGFSGDIVVLNNTDFISNAALITRFVFNRNPFPDNTLIVATGRSIILEPGFEFPANDELELVLNSNQDPQENPVYRYQEPATLVTIPSPPPIVGRVTPPPRTRVVPGRVFNLRIWPGRIDPNIFNLPPRRSLLEIDTEIEDLSEAGIEWSVYPNPTTDNITISVDLPEPQVADIKIYGLDGRISNVGNRRETLSAGKSDIELNVAHLVAGQHIVVLTTELGEVYYKTFIKK